MDAVGHRVVHGGSYFTGPALLTPEVIGKIEECAPLAPLHNPPALLGHPRGAARPPATPRRWPCSTPPSTPPSRREPTCTLCPTTTTSGTGCGGTASTASPSSRSTRTADAMLGGQAGGAEDRRRPPGQRGQHHRGRPGPVGGHQHGSHAPGGAGDGHPAGRRGSGRASVPAAGAGADRRRTWIGCLNKESGLLGVSGVSNDMRDVLEAGAAGDDERRGWPSTSTATG